VSEPEGATVSGLRSEEPATSDEGTSRLPGARRRAEGTVSESEGTVGESEGTVSRVGRVSRETKETKVFVEIDLDGPGPVEVETGVPFFDHMLAQLGKHGLLGLTVRTEGDTEIDAHHTVEDTSIALGTALKEALGGKSGISRFGDAVVPLDEVLVRAAVDLSGRPYVVHSEPEGMSPVIGSYDTTLTRHIWESLAFSAGICLHIHVLYGRNPHHIVEAQFKAVARALRSAAAIDPRAGGAVPSTKGVL
jgi:imidazoleglycerol-phosphate dehydratase